MAENSKNVLHGTKLTGLWPKKTFLSQSSKKLQIWHGTTLLCKTSNNECEAATEIRIMIKIVSSSWQAQSGEYQRV